MTSDLTMVEPSGTWVDEALEALVGLITSHVEYPRLCSGGFGSGSRGQGWSARGPINVGGISVGVSRYGDWVALDAALVPERIWDPLAASHPDFVIDGDDSPRLDSAVYALPACEQAAQRWRVELEAAFSDKKRTRRLAKAEGAVRGWFAGILEGED